MKIRFRFDSLERASRVLSILALYALLFGFCLGSAAQAQITLVSNNGQSTIFSGAANRNAQAFTTGSNTHGYDLSSVTLYGGSFLTSYGNTVTLHEGSRTGTQVADFSGSHGPLRLTLILIPTSPIVLDPSTEYFIVTSDDLVHSNWTSTASDNEDSGAADGWSIADEQEFFSSSNSWTTSTWPLKIAVTGVVRTAPPPINPPPITPPITTPPPGTTPVTPPGTTPSPTQLVTPSNFRADFDESALDSLVLSLSWGSVSGAADYEYKIFEGPPTSRVFPALIDWASTGDTLATNVYLERIADAYTIWLRAAGGDAKSEHAQIGAYVPLGIRSIVLRSGSETPSAFVLSQNYPNPFNPATTIRYELHRASEVRLAVYDLLGREVSVLTDGLQLQGVHTARFDAAGLPSGSYVYRLEAAGKIVTRVMTLSR